MLEAMTGSKPAKRKPTAGGKGGKRASTKASGRRRTESERSFPDAFAALLRSRKLRVPRGLRDAPPEAYANEPASFVSELERLGDEQLARFAERVATYAKRQAERARREWESSPLVGELRRRKLAEPERPTRVVGASVSLSKALTEWTDAEILRAAREWSERGRR